MRRISALAGPRPGGRRNSVLDVARDAVSSAARNVTGAVQNVSESANAAANAAVGVIAVSTEQYALKKGLEYDKNKIKSLKLLMLYCVFLAVFLAVILLPEDIGGSYDSSNAVQAALVETEWGVRSMFGDIGATGDIYYFLQTVMLPALFTNAWYNGVSFPLNSTMAPPWFLDDTNLVLGAARLRQVRVSESGCATEAAFASRASDCLAQYSSAFEDKADFRWGADAYGGERNVTAYESAGDLSDGGAWTSSMTKVVYSAGGYVVDLPVTSLEAALATATELESGGWIDGATRALFLEVSFYNPNQDQFIHSLLAVEALATGAFVATAEVNSGALLRIIRAVAGDSSQPIYLAAFIMKMVLYALVIGALARMADEIVDDWEDFWKYIRVGWNVMDLAMVVCFLANMALSIVWMLKASQINYNVDTTTAESSWDWDAYFELRTTMGYFVISRNFMAFGVLLAFLKSFKFVGVTPSLQSLSRTLSRAVKDIIPLIFIVGVVFSGYAMAFQMAFGYAMTEYRDFAESLLSLLMTLLGSFDMQSLRMVNPAAGTVLFVSFVVLVQFVVLSMLLKIVDVAFQSVMDDIRRAKGVLEGGNSLDIGLMMHSAAHDAYWKYRLNRTLLEATLMEKTGKLKKDAETPGTVPALSPLASTAAGAAFFGGRVSPGSPAAQSPLGGTTGWGEIAFSMTGPGLLTPTAGTMGPDRGFSRGGGGGGGSGLVPVSAARISDQMEMLLHRQGIMSRLAGKLDSAADELAAVLLADGG